MFPNKPSDSKLITSRREELVGAGFSASIYQLRFVPPSRCLTIQSNQNVEKTALKKSESSFLFVDNRKILSPEGK